MSLHSARAMLENVPVEIFDIWLDDFILRLGWPFMSVTDPVTGTGWEEVFGGSLSLETFANLSWNRLQIPFSEIALDQASELTLDLMLASLVGDGKTLGAGFFPRSRERFIFQLNHMKKTGSLLAPIVLTASHTGRKCCDGYHRLCALAVLENENFPVDCWIGSPNKQLQPTSGESG